MSNQSLFARCNSLQLTQSEVVQAGRDHIVINARRDYIATQNIQYGDWGDAHMQGVH